MNDEKKNRTVTWSVEIDELAVRLALEGNYYPEKTNGGVSKFLSDLVMDDSKPNAAIKKHLTQIAAQKTSMKKHYAENKAKKPIHD